MLILVLTSLLIGGSVSAKTPEVVVGSKKFTESVVLGEIARIALKQAGLQVVHKQELGGTRILWNALLTGDIDVYADYTGTLMEEILKKKFESFDELRAVLAEKGIGVLPPLGFNNTYAIGMKRAVAEKKKIAKISDLSSHPRIKVGWGDEFRMRQDGWVGLKARYRLPQRLVRGMDHDIAYRAMENGDIEVTDLYSTDAEIEYYDLTVLKDDLGFFPRYEALFLYRLDRADSLPELREALTRLSGKISDQGMIAMNRRAKIDRVPPGEVASAFLTETFGWHTQFRAAGRSERIFARSQEHLTLVLLSLLAAILAAIPFGILAAKNPRPGRVILLMTGIIQTVPGLAMLVILIRPLNWIGLSGIGNTPALIALFLYSLLPIVRGTHVGFQQIPLALRETAAVLDLSFSTRLWKIELPLAFPAILSGIKTSAVMNVGFATLGALVGAGGYGQPILTGIRLDDYGLILEGAVPAAVLALLVQQLFDFFDRDGL